MSARSLRIQQPHPARRQAGLTLVELMIAMVLGLVLTGAVVGVFISGTRSYQQDEKTTTMHDEIRFAMSMLVQDVEMAGFWGSMLNPAAPPLILDGGLTVSNDCGDGTTGWAYVDRTSVFGVDNADGADAAAEFECINPAEFQAGTDVLSIKRVAGTPTTLAALDAGSITLATYGTAGHLFAGTAPDTPIADPSPTYWAYKPAIYFIRNYAVTVGDGIPTLCRKTFVSGGYIEEALAEGIESLQVEYGVDSDADGTADAYKVAGSVAGAGVMTAGDFVNVSTVRIWLLVRSSQDKNYANEKTYSFSNFTGYTPNDNFYRKVLSATIAVRNPNALRVQLG